VLWKTKVRSLRMLVEFFILIFLQLSVFFLRAVLGRLSFLYEGRLSSVWWADFYRFSLWFDIMSICVTTHNTHSIPVNFVIVPFVYLDWFISFSTGGVHGTGIVWSTLSFALLLWLLFLPWSEKPRSAIRAWAFYTLSQVICYVFHGSHFVGVWLPPCV